MSTGSSTLLGLVKQLQLVDDHELSKLPPHTDPKVLVQKGLLTPYQLKTLQAGQGKNLVLGNYVFLEPLGEGGMGQVFKARHKKLDRIVALKLIKKERVSSASSLSRFQREAKAAARLSSPHIVGIFDADEANGTHFMAMEFVQGTDLQKLVAKNGPLPVPQACEYIRQAALGLQHAHENRLIHRDIKPSNLLVQSPESRDQSQKAGSPLSTLDSGLVKVLDFGLTLLEDDKDRKTRLTQTGAFLGTIDYMSPEQATSAKEADIRSDIYSLGCTLFYLLTGRLPFQGPDPMSRLMARVLEEPPSLAAACAGVSPELDAVFRKMLAKEPGQRFQTPAEVAKALEPFARRTALREKPKAIPVAAPKAPPPSVQARRSKVDTRPLVAAPVRRRQSKAPLYVTLAAAVLVVAAVVAGIGYVMVSGQPEQSKGAVALKTTPKKVQPPAKVDNKPPEKALVKVRPKPETEPEPTPQPKTEPEPKVQPTENKDWFVLFRSSDPSLWGKTVTFKEESAVSLDKAPENMRYLKLSRMDTRDFVIIRMSKEELRNQATEGRYLWQGTAHFGWNARQLGICDKEWRSATRGDVTVWYIEGQGGYRGWGFGVRFLNDDRQGYSWAGREISQTVFEIAVKTTDLTGSEAKNLVGSPTPAPGDKLALLQANYGAHDKWFDVTAKVASFMQNDVLTMPRGDVPGKPFSLQADLGLGDPVPNKYKALLILYQIGGRIHLLLHGDETGKFRLPPQDLDPSKGLVLRKDAEFILLQAHYGAHDKWIDVTTKVAKFVRNGGLSLSLGRELEFGDPVPGKHKTLVILYQFGGRMHLFFRGEDEAGQFRLPPAKF